MALRLLTCCDSPPSCDLPSDFNLHTLQLLLCQVVLGFCLAAQFIWQPYRDKRQANMHSGSLAVLLATITLLLFVSIMVRWDASCQIHMHNGVSAIIAIVPPNPDIDDNQPIYPQGVASPATGIYVGVMSLNVGYCLAMAWGVIWEISDCHKDVHNSLN